MDPYRKLKDFGEQSTKKREPKTWWQQLLSISWKVLLAIIVVVTVVVLVAVYFVGERIDSAVTAVLERLSIAMPDSQIRLASTIAVLGFTFPIVYAMFTFWKNKLLLAGIALLSLVGMVGFYNFTEEEMFGEGRDARFMCDSPVPTDPPFFHRSKKNPRMKGVDCEELTDPAEIAVAVMILRAQKSGDVSKAEPRVLTLEEIADPKLELYKNKKTLIYMSKMEDGNGLRQMRAGPWFDGFSPGTMVPATWAAIAKVRKFVADQKSQAADEEKRKSAEAAKAKADAEKATADKLNDKEKAYWQKRYADTVESMNLEARKASIPGMSAKEIGEAELMYLSLKSSLDEAKWKLSESERQKIHLEPFPNGRRGEVSVASSTPTATKPATSSPNEAKGPIVLRINFLGRQHPSYFNYGTSETHTITKSVEMNSTGRLCGSVKIQFNSGMTHDICEIKNHIVNGGDTYTIFNKSGGIVSAENM